MLGTIFVTILRNVGRPGASRTRTSSSQPADRHRRHGRGSQRAEPEPAANQRSGLASKVTNQDSEGGGGGGALRSPTLSKVWPRLSGRTATPGGAAAFTDRLRRVGASTRTQPETLFIFKAWKTSLPQNQTAGDRWSVAAFP